MSDNITPSDGDYRRAEDLVDRWHRQDRGSYVKLMDRIAAALASSRPLAERQAHNVLVVHQRRDIGSCLCGWGVETGHLGGSFVSHIIDELGRAGLMITEVPL